MKFLWAVSALLLCCSRADASTGKAFMSAMLAEDVDFALITKINHVNSDFVNAATFMYRIVEAASDAWTQTGLVSGLLETQTDFRIRTQCY